MVTLEAALAGAESRQHLLPPDAALQALPAAMLDEAGTTSLRHGQAVRCATEPAAAEGRKVRLYAPGRVFLGLGEARADGWLQPRRLMRFDAS